MSAIYDRILEQFTDYRSITTFWDDFSIAEVFGESAVLNTYNRAMKHWKDDYKYLTELVMVLNHKIWQHAGNPYGSRLAELYNSLWLKTDDYAVTHLSGDELNYYARVTD